MKILTALTIALAAAAVAQAQSADGKLPSNASSIFAELSGQLRFGFLAQKILLEVWVNKDHLIRKEGATLADGSWWGLWTGENSTGTVTAYAAVPDPINKARNHFWARFDEPAEVPMPAAILSHLLATAKQTKISGGDTLSVDLPSDSDAACTSGYTLVIRMTSGALLSTVLDASCRAN